MSIKRTLISFEEGTDILAELSLWENLANALEQRIELAETDIQISVANNLCAVSYLLEHGSDLVRQQLGTLTDYQELVAAAQEVPRQRFSETLGNHRVILTISRTELDKQAIDAGKEPPDRTMRAYLGNGCNGIDALQGEDLDSGLFILGDNEISMGIRELMEKGRLMEIGSFAALPRNPNDGRTRSELLLDSILQTDLLIGTLLSLGVYKGKSGLVVVFEPSLARRFTRDIQLDTTLTLPGYSLHKSDASPNWSSDQVVAFKALYPGYWDEGNPPSLWYIDIQEAISRCEERLVATAELLAQIGAKSCS